jgi:Xaa-Pro aminopeptidase
MAEEERLSVARKRIAELRQGMTRAGLDAYYVPSTDPHQSEYTPACWQRRQWLSGFSGSAGDLVVTRDTAGLWTDGRYFLQATEELRGSGIKLFRQGRKGVPPLPAWIGSTLKKGQALGADPEVLSRATATELESALSPAGARLKLLEGNLVDRIWTARPALPTGPVEPLPLEFSGEGVSSKLRRLRRAMAEKRADAHVLTALDAIAWLFNIRGEDVEHCPVVIAYAIVTAERAVLFVDPEKLGVRERRLLSRAVEVRPYPVVGSALGALAAKRRRVWVDGRTANVWVLGKLKGCPLITDPGPLALFKAKKNGTEIAGARAAHRRDGLALVRFLSWLERTLAEGGVTEISAGEKLAALRAEGEHYRGESFATIAALDGHGATIHYQASEKTDVPLAPGAIFLLDSGGQYLDGTTDVTRTILLAREATPEQRDRFTRVLKGHMAVARCHFPAGTAGRQIDTLGRLALWDAGLDYAHGTGHGVGAYLNVHEGPQAISHTRCTGVPLEEGNILSDEPGFYQEKEYGIRIESLLLTVQDETLSRRETPFLGFEVLTLCPIDLRLVEPDLLTAEERTWLDAYHRRVYDELAPDLAAEDRSWLRRATRPLAP